ncbi:uncharacterized protein B0H64DRAFT_50422 [Chaetomium fimeti]|uniref:DUF7730 domain-containing protein n=1 Tax=Chaetomium fimeti TaxID=1854472 RepID=A0AAE0LMU4_9PEZI|nr:hypothetical protein B0H64DRAFT_50422 [Chaetomium fimeti]
MVAISTYFRWSSAFFCPSGAGIFGGCEAGGEEIRASHSVTYLPCRRNELGHILVTRSVRLPVLLPNTIMSRVRPLLSTTITIPDPFTVSPTMPFPDPPLPALPSTAEFIPEEWRPSQQTQSHYFDLPLELRHLILRTAFGDRTIHIDLRSRNSLHPQPLHTDPCPPDRLWMWYSCFCYKRQRDGGHAGANTHFHALFADGCWAGGKRCCTPDQRDLLPEEGRIGVMGFLLSCKRACDEGLSILYATNTISVHREPFIYGLLQQGIVPDAPRLTGSAMQLVRSLQMRSPLVLRSASNEERSPREIKNHTVVLEELRLLPRAFPNLRRLEWIPARGVYTRAERMGLQAVEEIEDLLLRPLLTASAMMPALRELVVPLPFNLFVLATALERYRPKPKVDFQGQKLGSIRMWYPFTVRPGTPGPDGGGFWLVFGENQAREQEFDKRFIIKTGPLRHVYAEEEPSTLG